MSQFDVNNVITAFLDHRYENRADLVREIGAAMRGMNRPMNSLIAQVASACLEQPACTPEMTIRIGIMYGMVIGVLLERDRISRKGLAA